MMNSVTACVVITTLDSEESAEQMAQAIIQAGLGACVQIQPIKSYYKWQGKIANDNEFRLDIKTLDSAFEPLQALIKQLHGYETPEIIKMPIAGASAEYLAWLSDSISLPPSTGRLIA